MGYNKDLQWLKCELRDVLYYEQPTKYIVNDPKYNNSYSIPVLTAGKSFVLGYTNETNGVFKNLPCIIFDDFTTESKYVDFPFKVKSSAMKILKSNSRIDIKYAYYLIQQIKINMGTHKRYWISDYSKKEIIFPSPIIQHEILKQVDNYNNYFDKIKALLN